MVEVNKQWLARSLFHARTSDTTFFLEVGGLRPSAPICLQLQSNEAQSARRNFFTNNAYHSLIFMPSWVLLFLCFTEIGYLQATLARVA